MFSIGIAFWKSVLSKIQDTTATTGPPILLKMSFKRMIRFFFEKYFLNDISNLSKLKNFDFFWQKKFTIKVEKTFQNYHLKRIHAFYSKFSTFTDFEKIHFFSEENFAFLKKKFHTFSGNLLFQSYATENLLQFDDNIFSRSEPSFSLFSDTDIRRTLSIGK